MVFCKSPNFNIAFKINLLVEPHFAKKDHQVEKQKITEKKKYFKIIITGFLNSLSA